MSVPSITYRPESENKEFQQQQWRAYMGAFTDWSLEEAYKAYTRPGMGGKKWSEKEKVIFAKIEELSGSENPYIFRLMPKKIVSG